MLHMQIHSYTTVSKFIILLIFVTKYLYLRKKKWKEIEGGKKKIKVGYKSYALNQPIIIINLNNSNNTI